MCTGCQRGGCSFWVLREALCPTQTTQLQEEGGLLNTSWQDMFADQIGKIESNTHLLTYTLHQDKQEVTQASGIWLSDRGSHWEFPPNQATDVIPLCSSDCAKHIITFHFYSMQTKCTTFTWERWEKSPHIKGQINGMNASLTVPAAGGITILIFILSKVFYLKNVILSHFYKKSNII